MIAGADEFDSTVSSLPVPDYADAFSQPSSTKPVLGYFKQTLEHEGLDEEIRSTHKNFINQLKEDGYEVKELDFDLIDYIVPTYYVLTTAEASSNLSRYEGVRYGHQSVPLKGELTEFYSANRSEGFGKEVQRRIMLGTFVLSAGYYDAYYGSAQKVRTLIKQDFDNAFAKCDVLVSPTAPTTAFKIGEKSNDPLAMYLNDIATIPVNMAGIGGMSLPCGLAEEDNLPVGFQIMSPAMKDDRMYLVGGALEAALLSKWGKPILDFAPKLAGSK